MMYEGMYFVAPVEEIDRGIFGLSDVNCLSCKYSQHQSNQSYALHYDLPN